MNFFEKIVRNKLFMPIVLLVMVFTIYFAKNGYNSIDILGFLEDSGETTDEPANEIGQFIISWDAPVIEVPEPEYDEEGNLIEKPGPDKSEGIVMEGSEHLLLIEASENNVYNAETDITGGIKVTYQMIFNMGGSEEAEAGSIKIKFPKYLFYGRDDLPIGEQILDVPLVAAPDTTGTGFHYSFETDAETGDEYLVLVNYKEIPAAYSFECSISWILPTPSLLEDGYTRDFYGSVEVDLGLNGTIDTSAVSNTLSILSNSHAEFSSSSTSYATHLDTDLDKKTNVYTSWNKNWDESLKPENSSKYVYVVWYSDTRVKYATQPYTAVITSIPTDGLGGEVIAYGKCSSTNCNDSAFSANNNPTTDAATYKYTQPNETVDYIRYVYTLVKYPRDVIIHTSNGSSGSGSGSSSTTNPDISGSTIPDDAVVTTHTLSVKTHAELLGVDGATDMIESETSVDYTYVYQQPIYHYPGFGPIRRIDMGVQGNRTAHGAINYFQSKDPNTVEVRVGREKNYGYSFNSYGSVEDYSLTLIEGGDYTKAEDHGYRNWKYNHLMDTFILGTDDDGYTILEDGDYEITNFYMGALTLYDYIDTVTEVGTNPINVYDGWQSVPDDMKELYNEVIELYYKKEGTWSLFGTIKYDETKTLKFTNTVGDMVNVSGSNNKIELPEGTTGLKLIVESMRSKVYTDIYINVELKNSQTVLDIMEEETSVGLKMLNDMYSEDSKGIVYTEFDSINWDLPNSFVNLMNEYDIKRFGMKMRHAYTSSTFLNKLYGDGTGQNTWVNYVNDPANRRIKANYTTYAYEHLDYSSDVIDAESIFDSKIINEQRKGVFYSLLPTGMTPDLESVVVETFNSNTSNGTTSSNMAMQGNAVEFTTSVLDNYKNTGRTMLVVQANVPDDIERNYDNQSHSNTTYRLFSGFTVKFSGYYSWDSIYDYGNTLTNTVAYKSGSGALLNGYADDATTYTGTLDNKTILVDLDQDGNPENSLKDTVYSQRTLSFTFNTASDTSFKIGVRTAANADYLDGKDGSVVAAAGGHYTYRMRYASQKNVMTTDLVLYNNIETYAPDTVESWKGTFVSVDVSQAKAKGIDPVVYYSTKLDMDLYENGKASLDSGKPSDADLTNTEIWSTEAPEDLSTVTAIAVDLSKDVNGEPYRLVSEDSVLVLINMTAPVENASILEEKGAKAMNSAWWSGTTQTTEETHYNFSVYEWTEVLITEVPITLEKNSYIASGTEALPTVVLQGDKILYDILVINKSNYDTINNAIVIDNLPEGVTPIMSEIGYYIDGQGTVDKPILITDTSLVTMEQDGTALKFEVTQVLSSQIVHIIIPVNVAEDINNANLIINSAVLDGFNGIDYEMESNETYHEVGYGDLIISKNVVGTKKAKERVFEFTITLTPPVTTNIEESNNENTGEESGAESTLDNTKALMNRTYGDVTFVDGVATIKLKHGESKTIPMLPEGFTYKVVEGDYAKYGFSTTFSGATNKIVTGEVYRANFVNVYDKNADTKDFIVGVVIVCIVSLTGSYIIWRRKEKVSQW